jgi:ABC-type arginine transport system permease subunit
MKVRTVVKALIGFAVGAGSTAVVTSSVKTLVHPDVYSAKSVYGKIGIKLFVAGLAALSAKAVTNYYSESIDSLFDSVDKVKEAKEKYKGWTKEQILEDLAKQSSEKSE